MNKVKRIIINNYKLTLIIIVLLLTIIFSIGIPTFARYKNRIITTRTVWDGSIATSYRSGSGSASDPYIISNGSELALLADNLNTNNYENTYFKLTNDIIINEGIFSYEDNSIKYTINNETYYVKPYTNEYYQDNNYTLLKGNINKFLSLNNFKGNFDGNFYRIYGLYVSDSTKNELALFTNLNGNINNLYVENSLIYGGNISGGIVSNANDSNITNTMYNGFVISNNNETSMAAGIVAEASNVNLNNVVNKGKIISNNISSGLIGIAQGQVTINNSYNTGTIVSHNYSSGFIGNILSEETITINNSYNASTLESNSNFSFISRVESNSIINISNSFDATNIENIVPISRDNIKFNNCYYTFIPSSEEDTIEGLTTVTVNNLEDKDFVTNELLFNEFLNYEDYSINNNHIWIFNSGQLPKLFIDDSELSITINVQNYSWNNFTTEINNIYIPSSIIFSVNSIDEYNGISSIEYYISNQILTKAELENNNDWQLYNEITQINTEGEYIIYVKVRDNSNNAYYLNSDKLILDLTSPTLNINIDDNNWDNLSEQLDYIYIDSEKIANVIAVDEMTEISKMEYYISNEIISLEGLKDINWQLYEDNIKISNNGINILYVKVTDMCNNTTYVNTDYIVLDGYKLNYMKVGNTSLEDNINITDKSTIELNYNFNGNTDYNNITHNIVSNTVLPLGSKLIIKDNILHKYYKYVITEDTDYGYNENNVATYSFNLFKEIGSINNKSFSETSLEEDYTIILDLSNTNIKEDYKNVSLYIELQNQNKEVFISTLDKSKKYFNIYTKKEPVISLTSSTVVDSINYNSNSTTQIDFNSNIIFEKINEQNIYNSYYLTKDMYLKANLYNSDGIQISKNYLKNITLEYNDTKYYAYNDGSYYINLGSSINEIENSLKIITNEDISKLTNGYYTLKIRNYISSNGIYNNLYSGNEIDIPIVVINNDSNYTYEYNVDIPSSNRIMNKDNNCNLNFNVYYKGNLNTPSVVVSLYSKNLLTAYNQEYNIVDINKYVNNSLINYKDNYYYLLNNINKENNEVSINLDCSKLDYNGYKFVFDLYDNNKKIDTISKNVIVK